MGKPTKQKKYLVMANGEAKAATVLAETPASAIRKVITAHKASGRWTPEMLYTANRVYAAHDLGI